MVIRIRSGSIALAAIATLAPLTFSPSLAQAPTRFDIPAQDLGTSLRLVGSISGRQIIIATGAVEGKRAPSLHGSFSADEAIAKLLRDTDVVVRYTGDAVLVGGDADLRDPPTSGEGNGEITVTGTRIRGAGLASPLLALSTEEAFKAGQTSLASMAASIPQNFGGGQNPGVGQGVVPGNFNESGASTLNLRGLGGDATLTLVDGHRVAYTGSQQTVDISSLPFLAVDRLEVIADGASALYGSDAVAGVANIVLRKRYDGMEARESVGVATDGGDFSKLSDAIAGTQWTTGGVYGAYEHAHSTQIAAGERSYAQDAPRELTLYPRLAHDNALFRVDQQLGGVQLDVTGIFNHRASAEIEPGETTGTYLDNGARILSTDTSFAILPHIEMSLGRAWHVFASGSFAKDNARYNNTTYYQGASIYSYATCYCNTAATAEASAEGPVFRIGADSARLAIGAGYRSTRLDDHTDAPPPTS